MREEMEDPHRIRVARRERQRTGVARQTKTRVVLRDKSCAPAILAFGAVVERRIGEDVIGLEAGVLVVGVGIARANVAVDAVNEKVQSTKAKRELLRFLTEERELTAVMREHIALHEHAARTATWLEHLAF